jgi:hypothetical protein
MHRGRWSLSQGFAALALALASCGDDRATLALDAAPPADAAPPEPLGICGQVQTFPTLPSPHQDPVPPGSWNSNPPTSGPHSPAWAQWDYHYPELTRDHWIHNLEHGGVVLGYRCDAPCPALVDELLAVVPTLEVDPRCVAPLAHRALVVGDPDLPDGVSVFAAAWGVAYTATCVDAETLRAFYAAHVAQAPEDTCAGGLTFTGAPIE